MVPLASLFRDSRSLQPREISSRIFRSSDNYFRNFQDNDHQKCSRYGQIVIISVDLTLKAILFDMFRLFQENMCFSQNDDSTQADSEAVFNWWFGLVFLLVFPIRE